MLTMLGDRQRFCDGISRRSFLRIGGLSMGGLSLPALLRSEDESGRRSQKSVIMVYLPGGPTNLDLFDLKPDAPSEVRSPFGSIPTKVAGIRICEHLPRLAANMDKLAVVRTLVGMESRHESFQCHTGRPGGQPKDNEPAGGWPSLGSTISRIQGPASGGVPPFVDVGPKMGHRPYNNLGWHDPVGKRSWPGFLGVVHTPLQLEGDSRGDFVLNGIDTDRFGDRKGLLGSFDDLRAKIDNSAVTDAVDRYQRQSFEILTSSKLADALDLEREDPKVRARYGVATATTSSFGGAPKDPQKLLLARRLVEAGVRVVSVAFGAWDWHGNRGGPVEKLGKEDFPQFDHALATLIEDLHERGMDKDVTVVAWGEFGRTPKINAKGGRDHWNKTACAMLAGGGMRTGQVIGATDAQGAEPVDRPVHVQEVFATLYHNLGIEVNSATVNDHSGRPRYLIDEGRQPIRELI